MGRILTRGPHFRDVLTYETYNMFLSTGRRNTVECLSPNHLYVDGGCGRTAGSSLQQLEYHPVQVSNEISPPEGKDLEVRKATPGYCD